MENKIETFPDGSTIETDATTGNQTVIGSQAHAAYFKRQREARETPVLCVGQVNEIIRKEMNKP